MVTGSCFGWMGPIGENFAAPLRVLLRMAPPCHGALLMWCHNVFMEPKPTRPALHEAMKWDNKDSEASIQSSSGMSESSQIFVNSTRPAT